MVINSVIVSEHTCDLLIIDEIHRVAAETFSKVFDCVKYKLILGLTATIERLDGKHAIFKKYCPVVDIISTPEAVASGWLSPYIEYEVLIDVPDIDVFKNLQSEFTYHFEFFNFNWELANSMTGSKGVFNKLKYRDILCKSSDPNDKSRTLKEINNHAMGFYRSLTKKKKFINNHPKKLELVRKIIKNRPNSKIITFSNNIEIAKSIGIGKVYSGRDTKKKGRMTLEEFQSGKELVLNTIKKCDEGLDVKGLSVAIILGLDSAKNKAVQRIGRVIRFEEGKRAEIFNLILKDTTESKWFDESHKGLEYIRIDEEGLDAVLKGETPKPYKEKIKNFTFRY